MSPVGWLAQVACVWEVTARKVGDVNRQHDFETLTYPDFILSAAAIAPVLESASERRVGDTILQAVNAMRRVTTGNPHLGTILLLAPLSAASRNEELRRGVATVLEALDLTDARAAYQAIRLAQPSGLGQVDDQDVRDEPTLSMRQVMERAAERDLVARQYATGFREVFELGLPALLQGIERTGSIEGGILFCQLVLLANHPDSLIGRKRGLIEAAEASSRAAHILELGWPDQPRAEEARGELDVWLREKGMGRNPGTTADMVVACLFAGLREGNIELHQPFAFGRR